MSTPPATPCGIPIGPPHGVTREVASHVLHHYGAGGYPPGHFTHLLVMAAASADPTNLQRLALGFPEYVAAVRLARDVDGGIDVLRSIAGELGSVTTPH